MIGPLGGIHEIPREMAVHLSTSGNSHGRIDNELQPVK